MYDFMARHLGLDINAVKDKSGKIDESKVTIEKYDAQLVFGKEGKLPVNAVKGLDNIKEMLLKSLEEYESSCKLYFQPPRVLLIYPDSILNPQSRS